LALDLVGYEDEVYQAMEWIFGSTFICRDAKTAKEVTFHKDIRVKSVTYDGDVYDPQGTLSGGSKPNTSGILVKLQELNEIRADIRHHNEKLEKLEREIRSNQQIVGEYNRLKQRLDLKSHELHLLQQRMSNSTHAQLAARIQSLKEQMEEQENAKQDAKKAEEKAKTECGRIEKEMADFNANKDTKLEEMTVRLIIERLCIDGSYVA
jgi:structural maintenance of chromosome 2